MKEIQQICLGQKSKSLSNLYAPRNRSLKKTKSLITQFRRKQRHIFVWVSTELFTEVKWGNCEDEQWSFTEKTFFSVQKKVLFKEGKTFV